MTAATNAPSTAVGNGEGVTPMPMSSNLTLHDYQEVAVDWLHTHPRAGLFLDMGL